MRQMENYTKLMHNIREFYTPIPGYIPYKYSIFDSCTLRLALYIFLQIKYAIVNE